MPLPGPETPLAATIARATEENFAHSKFARPVARHGPSTTFNHLHEDSTTYEKTCWRWSWTTRGRHIPQVSQSHPQMMMQCVRNADGKAQPKQSLGETEGVEVVVATEQRAGDCSPDQSRGREWKVRQVRRGEQYRSQSHGGAFAREQARQTGHEQVIQEDLLVERPQDVAADVFEIAFVQRVQRTDLPGRKHAYDCEKDGGGKNPQRWRQTVQ